MTTTAASGPAVNRRRLLRVMAAAGLWLGLSAHSPYRQWDVHRKMRLIVLVSRDEPSSVTLGSALAAVYAQQLPDSRAVMARARDTNDVVRLMASKQLDVALLRERDADAAAAGRAPYADSGAPRLRALAVLGDFLFVCRDDLPVPSAYMLTEALAERWRDVDPALVRAAHSPRPPSTLAIPLHPGALEYYRDHQ
jgi:TRAP-type uncharacterized transport system substrate-binding protein